MSSSLSSVIADYTLRFSLEQVPFQIQEYAKYMVLDAMGCAVSAVSLPHAISVRKTVLAVGSQAKSTLWGTDKKVGMADAILANSSLIHGMDYDDTHVGGIVHPSAGIVATAFSVGEAIHANGKEILEAIVCGYEIIIRLALAARGGFHEKGFHGTGIVTPFAAACVAAKLLHYDTSTLINALGICGSQAAALQEFLHDGAWVKKIHPGWGGHSAIYSLMMARNGLTGPQKVFEGEFGLYKTHIGTNKWLQDEFSNLGSKWHTADISIKLYPCCHMIHSFIDCAFKIRQQANFDLDKIQKIECRINKTCYSIVCSPENAKKRPTSDYGMRFSLPYMIAMSFYKGKIGPGEIDLIHMENPEVTSLIDKIQCIPDDTVSNEGHFPGWVKVTFSDGKTCTMDQKYEQGAKENPIKKDSIISKYYNNTALHLPLDKAKKIMENILNLETCCGVDSIIDNLKS